MPTIRELHEIHLRQLDSVIKESELLLQREGGLDGELHTSGWICEKFIKTTLENLCVPSQFRVVSGYIATPDLLKNKANLPQCDLIIVDRQIPPLFRFQNSDIEVVPRESVCGIIEIKRTLTVDAIYPARRNAGALAHLAKIIDALGESELIKTDQKLNLFNRHVGFDNSSSDKPLLGIIALQNTIPDFNLQVPDFVKKSGSLVDFIWTFDGYAMLPAFSNQGKMSIFGHTARPATKEWSSLTENDFAQAESAYLKSQQGIPTWLCLGSAAETDKATTFAQMLGVLSIMLSRTFGRTLRDNDINEYYFTSY